MANHLFDRLIEPGVSDAPALLTGRRDYSYAELKAETARWASALVSLGVQPGDRVAVQVEKSAANLILYLATIRAGAVFLPLNTGYTLNELAFFIADAEPALIVCDPSARDGVASMAGTARVETLDGEGEGTLAALASRQAARFETVARGGGDLAAICYTSGTTGKSKGAMLTHGNLASNARTLKDLWRFTADDVLIHALPIFHVHGLFVATNVLMMAGAAMILQPRFDAGAVVEAMPRATSLMGVPTFYTRLLAHPDFTREAAKRMRLFVSGSAPLLAETHRAFFERTGQAILERYGMTETGMMTSNPYDGERRAGTVGFPLPGVEVRIAAAAGEIGGIEVRGPGVFSGYWRNREKTAAAFRADGWFVTGDLGVIEEDGYVSIVGRETDLIITGGLNVYPKEVEARIDAIPGVVESAVIGLSHADLGEAVTAIVVADGTLTETAIIEALGATLARFKQPRRVILAHELPRNAMGKVQKAALRARHAGLYAAGLNGASKAST
ncbi:MAG TPA: malonyl-CoA synthase [Caulobacteraceae bacterium]|nr:malonyl-CoA synthase [Caulobacteraceae bacterium]